MHFERTKAYKQLKKSITQNLKDRGLTDTVYVENRSVSLSVQVSKQMLAIMKSLGISDLAKNARSGDDDEL